MDIQNEKDVINAIKKYDVKFIRLQFTDIQGVVKDVEIPVAQIEKALTSGIGFDGSSIEGFVRIYESDMLLKPDVKTFALLPWYSSNARVARIICDIYKTNGEPFRGDPRNVLENIAEEASKMGFTLNVGPEMEFFLFEKENGIPTTKPHDYGSYFEFAPTDVAEDIRRDIVQILMDLNFDIEASHHEVAYGQHEIDFKYGDALKMADNVVTFKYVTRTIAKIHGLHATFMPKPIATVNGSGMHVNLSLFKDGKNAFYDPDAEMQISDTARYFIAGVLNHIKAITCISNPIINSYKRLIPGYEAPVYIAWSGANRSSLIRIPSPRGNSTRIELRSPDPSCNPYLTFAAIFGAGLDGIKNKTLPTKYTDFNIFELSEKEREIKDIENLPGTLNESSYYFEQDELMKKVLGTHVHDNILRIARAEWNAYKKQVHDWEIQRYLHTI